MICKLITHANRDGASETENRLEAIDALGRALSVMSGLDF